ncbi:hypothetical protein KFE25_002344 [Diacronema lutheri]|uniref:Uncharacterized protein n=1 Tax=Diacronema lutheri TaxID=2081491 RepID=A0A8J5XLK2_DIALT|nr:hypothetical protein KFE25_002344 [Diacronema lutheri]
MAAGRILALVVLTTRSSPSWRRDEMGRRVGPEPRKSWAVRRCVPGTPSCVDEREGSAAEWAAYLAAVYGESGVPTSARRSLEWFYRCPPNRTANVSCGALPPPAPLSARPREVKLWQTPLLGEAFCGEPKNTDGLYAAGLHGFFVKRRSNNTPAPDGAWVEVLRGRKDDEATFNSTWYYVVRGSGVWLNVGATAHATIGARKKHHRLQVAAARAAGYDTLQFANAWDVDMHELVDLRPGARQDVLGLSTCGTAPLRTGWHHALHCACDEGAQLINCGGARRARLDAPRGSAPPTRRRVAAVR